MNKAELIEELELLPVGGDWLLPVKDEIMLSVKRSNKEGVTGYSPRRGGSTSSFGSVSSLENANGDSPSC
ncbi:hypothetical protein L484_003294 [Morus notabilis]|uniref:Uncharacterized protein n=1 Tax=Morus notabilis TaxID=981085 RepID=W9QHH1_9ROSA|nr:hypothetical protein L484_003294 [Morus notabilis]